MGDAIGEGLKSGAKHGLGEIKNALSHIKGTMLTLGGIAGGVGLAEMGKHALNAELQFKRLNFAIKAGTGKEFAGGYRALQKQIQSMAVETGQTTKDLAGSFQHLFTKTGDLSFTSSAIKDIAKASTASGHSMESLVEVVDGANGAVVVSVRRLSGEQFEAYRAATSNLGRYDSMTRTRTIPATQKRALWGALQQALPGVTLVSPKGVTVIATTPVAVAA
jgi:hypothetical protein